MDRNSGFGDFGVNIKRGVYLPIVSYSVIIQSNPRVESGIRIRLLSEPVSEREGSVLFR